MKIAVVGAGVIGLSAARELILSGEDVEIFDSTPGRGASAGNSRIFRQSHDDPRMTKASRENTPLWEEWSKEASRKLVDRCGLLYVGAGARKRYGLLKQNHIPCQWKEDTALFQGPSLWENGAGSINCVQVFSFLLQETQGSIRRESVHKISPGRVQTVSKEERYDVVLSLAGEGTLRLLPLWSEEIGLESAPHMRIDFTKKGDLPAIIDHGSEKYGVPGRSVYSIGGGSDLTSSRREILQFATRLGLNPKPLGYTICSSLQIAGLEEGWRAKSEDGLISFVGANSYKWAPLHGREIARLALGEDGDETWAALAGVSENRLLGEKPLSPQEKRL